VASCYAPHATLATMTDHSPSELDRLADVRAAYAAMGPRVASAEPWELASAFGTEPEASWGPRELLAHVAEMLPFWFGEMERIVDGPLPGPTPFGRMAEDASRIGLIERDRTLPLRVLFARVDAGLREWSERLSTLTAEERAKVGRHPLLGDVTVNAMLDRFILGHAEGHIEQLEGILATRPTG
jgi:hypothetical protein